MNPFLPPAASSSLALAFRSLFLLPGLWAATATVARAQADLAGVWVMEGGRYTVQVTQQSRTWRGTIVALGPGVPPKDVHNPDPIRRTRNLVGADLFWNLRWNPTARRFTDGRIYAIDRGREISAEAWLDDRNTLRVQGRVLLMTRTITFQRALNSGR